VLVKEILELLLGLLLHLDVRDGFPSYLNDLLHVRPEGDLILLLIVFNYFLNSWVAVRVRIERDNLALLAIEHPMEARSDGELSRILVFVLDVGVAGIFFWLVL
jgi:hypothetical protein